VSTAISALVLLTYGVFRLTSKQWGPRIIPIAAFLVMLARPGGATAEKVQSLPLGLLILIASFLFFALGTAAALTRARWHR
jgi:hypothetical protein